MQNKSYYAEWLTAFGKSLTEEQKEKAGIGNENGFLWHAFSYKFIPCLEGDAARAAYDKADKNGAKQAFYELCEDEHFSISDEMPISDRYLSAKQIDESEDIEVYIIGNHYSWCYIRTHEETCGPYFYSQI